MDAGFFDVLHDASHEHIFAVAQRIDVHFRGVGEIAVDQHRAVAGNGDGLGDVAFELSLVADDFHGPAAEHVGGADHHRETDPPGDALGLRPRAGNAIGGLPELELAQDHALQIDHVLDPLHARHHHARELDLADSERTSAPRRSKPAQEKARQREAIRDVLGGRHDSLRQERRQPEQPVLPGCSRGPRHRPPRLRRHVDEIRGRSGRRALRKVESEAELGQKLGAQIDEAEKRIAGQRAQVMEGIEQMAGDIAADVYAKLAGQSADRGALGAKVAAVAKGAR